VLVRAGLDVALVGEVPAPQRGSSNNEDTHPHAKMGVEDQKEEREILESIYPEEITGIHYPNHPSYFSALTPPLQIFLNPNSE
jgi:hypothetical protein